MSVLNTPFGQALITIGTAAVIGIGTAIVKMFGRMSRVEGKLELLIGMVANALDMKPADHRWQKTRRTTKGARNRE